MRGGESLSKKLREIAERRSVSARVGILESKTYPDGQGVAQVAFWNEYGTESGIPPRPFFRKAISDNQNVLPKLIGKLLKNNDSETALKLACEHMVDELKQSVMTWSDPPNAKSTIRKKGFNAPLRGKDRLLRNSFSYEVDDD